MCSSMKVNGLNLKDEIPFIEDALIVEDTKHYKTYNPRTCRQHVSYRYLKSLDSLILTNSSYKFVTRQTNSVQ